MALADLTGVTIQLAFADDASGKRFEEFVRRLLETERARRHVPGSTAIAGPSKAGVADGGKDIIVDIGAPPNQSQAEFAQPLTWDGLGKTWYSLKTGARWRDSVLKDVGYGGTLTGPSKKVAKKKVAKKKAAKKKAAKKKPPSPKSTELLDRVAQGTRYVIVTSEPADDGAKLLPKVIAALEYHMQAKRLTPPADWREKINFLSANELASFVRHHRPILPSELDARLGLQWPAGLERWDQWTRRLELGRKPPEYVPDDHRRKIIAALRDPETPRVIRIFGPPGVGKTRLVHHALEHAGQTDAVFCTESMSVADTVVMSRWIEHDAGAVILVVDEVASTNAESLTRDFLSRDPGQRGARLILIGVSDEDARDGLDRFGALGTRLRDLSTEATRELVETEIGPEAAERENLVDQVLELANGYPWFAILLAKALVADDEALATGDDEANRWDAAKRVLAGSWREYPSKREWQDEATARALCLLVVIITGDLELSWDELWHRHGDELRAVLPDDADWARIKAAEGACIAREILRHRGRSNKRYVSPANLARMILNHFFGDGPNDLGPRLHRHGARFHERVVDQAAKLGATTTVRNKLIRALLAEIDRRRAGNEALDDILGGDRAGLRAAVEELPELAATTLSATIQAHDRTQLAAHKQLRHALRGSFEALVQAPVSQRAFAMLEDALFRMALVEDERWANNSTGIWRSLFLVALSQTHQPWSFRFGLLRRRCSEGSATERRLAIDGLAGPLGSTERGIGHAPGRSWPMPSVAVARERKREAWVLALELCTDATEDVAARAREVVIAELRGCVMDEVAIDAVLLDDLAEQVERWSVAQRQALAETLADIRRYDYDSLAPDIQAALAELEQRTRPVDFGERLVAQVGSWHPGPWAISDERRAAHEQRGDEALVDEAIAEPSLLIDRWSWLSSNAAKRRRPFMRTLGRLDLARRFLVSLEHLAQHGTIDAVQVLAWYVEGWSLAPDHADADRWLAQQLAGGANERAAGWVAPFLEPNDQRLDWLIDRVERGRADTELTAMSRRWVAHTSPPRMVRLLDAITTRPELAHVGVSLARALLERELDPALRQRATASASALLIAAADRRLPAFHEHEWQRLVLALAHAGAVEAAVEATVQLIVHADQTHLGQLVDTVVRELSAAGHAAAIWERATALLTGDRAHVIAWYLGHAGLAAHVDVDRFLDWIGEQEARAELVTQLINPYGPTLPELARALLRRFGAEGPVACALAARVRTTLRPVRSLLEFKRRQFANAERWAEDPDAEVRRWANRLTSQLREAIAQEEAQEALRKLG